jgi:hypothetical protein
MATAAKAKTTTATAKDSEAAAEETNPLAGIYEGPDMFSGKFLLRLHGFITEFNNTNQRLIAADGDRNAAVKNFIETSDDEVMTALRAELKSLQEKIQAHADASVKTETFTDEQKAAMKEELKTLREKVAKGSEVARDAFEMNEVDVEAGHAAVAKMLELMPAVKRGKAKGTTGSSLPRAYCKLNVSGGALGESGEGFRQGW